MDSYHDLDWLWLQLQQFHPVSSIIYFWFFKSLSCFVVGCLDFKGQHMSVSNKPIEFFSPCLGVLTLFAKSQAMQAIGKSYLESYILEFLHLQAVLMSIDLAAISRSKYFKVHRNFKFLSDGFESHKVIQLVCRLGTLPNGYAKTWEQVHNFHVMIQQLLLSQGKERRLQLHTPLKVAVQNFSI